MDENNKIDDEIKDKLEEILLDLDFIFKALMEDCELRVDVLKDIKKLMKNLTKILKQIG